MSSSNSRVIKAGQVKLVVSEEEGLERTGRNLSGSAGDSTQPPPAKRKSEIEHLKSEYEKRIQAVEKDAFARGMSEGARTGADQVRKEAIKSIEALQTQLKEVALLRKSIMEKAEKDILSLSISIAEKILQQEVRENPDTVQNILRAAMKNILDRDNIKVRLNPQDFHYMMDKKEDFLQSFDGIRNIVFEEDGSIIKGGAVIETQFGEVDARIDRQFAEVKNMLMSSTN
jgi:flagellar assembly protein FliH